MEKINDIIDRYFDGELSEQEEATLKAFLASEAGQAPEYDSVRAVMGYFAVGRSIAKAGSKGRKSAPARRVRWGGIAAAAACLAMLLSVGIGIYNKENMCVSFVEGRKITDREVVMNDVDNILADLLSSRTDIVEQLNEFFGE